MNELLDIRLCNHHVQVKVKGEDMTFALKMIKKKHVVDNRQEEHIHSERRILAEARSAFVVKWVPLPGLKNISNFHPPCRNCASPIWENSSVLISFRWDHSQGSEPIAYFVWCRMAKNIEMSAEKNIGTGDYNDSVKNTDVTAFFSLSFHTTS